MATHIPLVIGSTVPIAQLPDGDTLSAPITVTEGDVILGRLSSGGGGHEEISPSLLTEDTTLSGSDAVLGWNSDGQLRKYKVGAFGGGGGGGDSLGTGFTSGGGSGTIPDGTVVTLDGDFTINGPLILDAGDGSTYRHVLLSVPVPSSTAYFEIYNTDESTLILEYYSDNSGTTSSLSFGANGFDFRAFDGINERIMTFTPNNINFKQKPFAKTNASAENGELYYSTTNSKLCYKDPGGTVNELY